MEEYFYQQSNVTRRSHWSIPCKPTVVVAPVVVAIPTVVDVIWLSVAHDGCVVTVLSLVVDQVRFSESKGGVVYRYRPST